MLYLEYSIFVIILTIGFAWMRRDSIFSPVGITSFVWLFVFVLGTFFYERFFPFTEKIFLLWLCWFAVSCFCFLIIPGHTNNKPIGPVRFVPFDYSLFLLMLIIWLIYRTYEVGNSGPGHFLLNLRLAATELSTDDTKLGFVGRFYPLIFALFIFESINSSSYNRMLRFLLWVWMLSYAVATMGKFAILTPILAWLVVKHRKDELSWVKLTLISSAILSLMLLMHIIRARETETFGLLDILGVYVYSPIIALNELEVAGSDTIFAEYTFRFFYAIKHFLFGGIPPVETILGFVMVPEFTNVYTVIQPFYSDFGVAGVIAGALAYGCFWGILYRFNMQGGQFGMIVYSGLAISLVSQIFAETGITNFSGNLQFIIATALVVFFSKQRKVCL